MENKIFLHLLPDFNDSLDTNPELCAVISSSLASEFTIAETYTFNNFLTAVKFKLLLVSVSQFRNNQKTTNLSGISLSIAQKSHPELFVSPITEKIIHDREPEAPSLAHIMSKLRSKNAQIIIINQSLSDFF